MSNFYNLTALICCSRLHVDAIHGCCCRLGEGPGVVFYLTHRVSFSYAVISKTHGTQSLARSSVYWHVAYSESTPAAYRCSGSATEAQEGP